MMISFGTVSRETKNVAVSGFIPDNAVCKDSNQQKLDNCYQEPTGVSCASIGGDSRFSGCP